MFKITIRVLLLSVFLLLNLVSATAFACLCDQSESESISQTMSNQTELPCHHDKSDDTEQDQSDQYHTCDGDCGCHVTHSFLKLELPVYSLELIFSPQSHVGFYKSPVLSNYSSQLKYPPKQV